MSKPHSKARIWYVAVGDVSGEYEGNPLAFDASQVYGPFTHLQAKKLVALTGRFPHATLDGRMLRIAKMPYRDLRAKILDGIAQAKADAPKERESRRESGINDI